MCGQILWRGFPQLSGSWDRDWLKHSVILEACVESGARTISTPDVTIDPLRRGRAGGGWRMLSGQMVFSQLREFFPRHEFNTCVHRYEGDSRLRGFSCRDQFLCLAFAQLTFRESLRDIETWRDANHALRRIRACHPNRLRCPAGNRRIFSLGPVFLDLVCSTRVDAQICIALSGSDHGDISRSLGDS